MQQNSGRFTKVTMRVLGVLVLASLAMPREATADEAFDWNLTGFEATVEGGQNPILISRTMTMMHLAVHDALNAIERRYEPYLYVGRAEPGAAPVAAIAAAAHDVLVEVIPAWGKPEQRGKALGIWTARIIARSLTYRTGRRRITASPSERLLPQRFFSRARPTALGGLRNTLSVLRPENGNLTPILRPRILR